MIGGTLRVPPNRQSLRRPFPLKETVETKKLEKEPKPTMLPRPVGTSLLEAMRCKHRTAEVHVLAQAQIIQQQQTVQQRTTSVHIIPPIAFLQRGIT